MAARAKRIKIDNLETVTLKVDSAGDSYLEKPYQQWPEGLLFPVARAVYARTMMIMGEAKVTFGTYSDGSLTREEMAETYYITSKHDGAEPPMGTQIAPIRLDTYVTLNLVEMEEMRKLVTGDDDKNREENYFLSDETANPFKRGRVLIKNGKKYKLANAGIYENGVGGLIRRYDTVNLGDVSPYLKKICKILSERLAWLEENRRFAGAESTKNMEEVRNFLKQRSKNVIIQNMLSMVDADPAKWGNKQEIDWVNAAKEEYRRMDRNAMVLAILTADTITMRISGLTLGDLREMIAKSLASQDHVGSTMQGLFERGSTLGDKRKILVDKHGKRKRKAQVEAPEPVEPMDPVREVIIYDDFPEASQDMW